MGHRVWANGRSWLVIGLMLIAGPAFTAEMPAEAAEQVAPPPAVKAADAPAETAPATAPTVTLDEMLKSFGWDFESAVIKATKLADGLYFLEGLGGNIVASIGPQGTLLVDDQFPQLMPRIEAALKNLGGTGEVTFAINTHWHFDHAEGNLALGPKGTWLVAQESSRAMMLQDHTINLVAMKYVQKAYPEAARPTLTFGDEMSMHFNGDKLSLMHFGPAHTTGDAAVRFHQANVVHMGDVFNAGYPFIDVDSGGDIDGVIHFCEAVLTRINKDTKVVPGHGPVQDRQALVDYITMLRTLRNRVAAMVVEGKSLEEVLAAKPTAEFDERYGDPSGVVDRAYASLTRRARRALEALEAGATE